MTKSTQTTSGDPSKVKCHTPETSASDHNRADVTRFNWSAWRPEIRSTLVFVVRDDQILLIHKKTGLGQGKINGPGGKLEAGEDWLDCARREVSEELRIEVGKLRWAAELKFLMSDYGDILCQAFIADAYSGEPVETREAAPFWSAISEIPWAQMWADDQYWLPRALLGERVLGLFSFQGEEMRSLAVHRHTIDSPQAQPLIDRAHELGS